MTALLEVLGARKAYGGTIALANADLEVMEGTIHGIVGPNGAGKSTLMRIIGGYGRRDAGIVRFRGREVNPPTPVAAQHLGIVTVPQEIALADRLSVAANIQLGVEPHWGPFVTSRALRAGGAAVLERLGLQVPLNRRAGLLRADEQRLLMFAQSMARQASLLILDEPTAGLNGPEAEIVLAGMERLREQGRTQLFVSHRFNEVLRVCDRVTVVRDGRTVEAVDRSELTVDDLVATIVGASADDDTRDSRHRATGAALLQARDLTGRELRGVSFTANAGEILGVVGLAGSGVEELLAIIGGAEPADGGSITVDERPVKFAAPADALDAGVAFLPADRTRAALLSMSIQTNVSLSKVEKVARFGLLNRAQEEKRVRHVLEKMRLADRSRRPLSSLSGGNRQKALIARAIFADARILAFADPTVGVDVQARRELHAILRDLAETGHAVVISATEAEELVAVADRVLVLRHGQLAATLEGDEISPESLVRASTT